MCVWGGGGGVLCVYRDLCCEVKEIEILSK